jgi:hypothetical protein
MYLSIIILPLLSSLVSGFLGRKVGVTGSQIITCGSLIVTSVFFTIAFYEVGICGSPVNIEIINWLDIEILNISWSFYFDQLTVSLGLAVIYCSTLIHIYSVDYLSTDPALCRLTRGKTLLWVKLSNSGNILKLLVPNYSRKTISGQNNYLGRVTSQKMSENEMGYRGSKSKYNFNNKPIQNKNYNFVKEQRVDGSYFINKNFMILRCTLMGFERNYPVKIPSKQLKKNFSTFNYPTAKAIEPWFITGFTDAEGSFSIVIDKVIKRKLGWRVQHKFQIGLDKRDLSILLQIQQFLGGIGSIYCYPNQNKVNYSIDSIKDLTILINHFNKYPLLTQKLADFLLFKQIIELIKKKNHLNLFGLYQIINIKASMNLGLSNMLKSEFKDFIPIERPIINTENIPDPNWIAGFVSGDGNFDVNITAKASTHKIGSRAQLRFRITQHDRDIKLMENIAKYLGSGKIYKYPNKSAVSLTIVKLSDIINIVIPFFNKNSLFGVKLFDYLDWCEIAKLMIDSKHLTLEGLDLIRSI